MTVYELIQELCQYDADAEVSVNVKVNCYRTDARVMEDAENGDYVDSEVEFEETVDDFAVEEERSIREKISAVITVELE